MTDHNNITTRLDAPDTDISRLNVQVSCLTNLVLSEPEQQVFIDRNTVAPNITQINFDHPVCERDRRPTEENASQKVAPPLCSECNLRPMYTYHYKFKPGVLADEDWFDPNATYYTPNPDSDTEDDPVYLCVQCDINGWP